MIFESRPNHVLSTAPVNTDMGPCGEDRLLRMRITCLKESHSLFFEANGALWQKNRTRDDLGEDHFPRQTLFVLEVLAEALKVKRAISYMHLNTLLRVVDEKVVRCQTLELVGLGEGVDFRTKLARGE